MLYSPKGSQDKTKNWADASVAAGCTPAHPSRGERRTPLVDAWVLDTVRASGTWLSELAAEPRKAVLKELGLPVKKQLVYRNPDGSYVRVEDVRIEEVWDGWCGLRLRLEGGDALPLPVHSQYLAEMNQGATVAG